VRRHRLGFAAYWRWKSRRLSSRPRIGKEVRNLIQRMSLENPLWGAPRIHGELLKLGINVAQSTVSIYMVPRQGRPLQGWKTFLRNHGKRSHPLICLSFRRLPFGGSSYVSFLAINGGSCWDLR
jgi:hypothetical protein